MDGQRIGKVISALGVGEGVGMAAAAGLTLLVWLLLPPERRRSVLLPVALLALALGSAAVEAFVEPRSATARTFDLLVLFFLLLSFARSSFLLVVHGIVIPRLHAPFPKIFQDMVQAVIYAAAGLITLRAAGVEPGSLLTTSALLTAVIGLSLQDTLGNMFAGLAIQIQRPFHTGDWIQFDERPDHIGQVIEMNWRAVRIITLERVEVTVPNSKVADAPILNYSKPGARVRRSAYIVAPYDTPPDRVRGEILRAIGDVPGILNDPPPSVLTHDYTERGVQYWVRFFISDFGRREWVTAEVRDRMWYALRRARIDIPAPLRDVQLRQVTPEAEAQLEASERDERARILGDIEFLGALGEEDRRDLAARSQRRLYAPGERIIRQGETGEELFIVERGSLRVLREEDDRQERELATLGAGDFFGERSVMTGSTRRATVQARSEVSVLIIDKAAFRAVLEKNPALVDSLSQELARREASGSPAPDGPRGASGDLDARRSAFVQRIRRFFAL